MSYRHGTCAKCGGGDVRVEYTEQSLRAGNAHGWGKRRALHSRRDEHLDYTCETCGFEWESDCRDKRPLKEIIDEAKRDMQGVLRQVPADLDEEAAGQK